MDHEKTILTPLSGTTDFYGHLCLIFLQFCTTCPGWRSCFDGRGSLFPVATFCVMAATCSNRFEPESQWSRVFFSLCSLGGRNGGWFGAQTVVNILGILFLWCSTQVPPLLIITDTFSGCPCPSCTRPTRKTYVCDVVGVCA